MLAHDINSRPNGPNAFYHPALTRLEYAGRYRELLQRHLSKELRRFADFFSDTNRLLTLARCLGAHFHGENKRVLNVGCGPFATELFVSALQGHTICSVDYTPEFAAVFELLRQEGLLDKVDFKHADIRELRLPAEYFDLVILHDILYEQAMDLSAILGHCHTVLVPGGVLYLDFMNLGVRWLWRLLGRERDYRRYDPSEVMRTLDRHGFEVLQLAPVQKHSTGLAGFFHSALWAICRTSNSIAVMAVKGSKAPSGDANRCAGR